LTMHLSSKNVQNNTTVMSISENHQAFEKLEQGVMAALETYANVHRGAGHHSVTSTLLYEQARERLLAHWGLDNRRYTVIFGSPYLLRPLLAKMKSGSYHQLTSRELGLPLGLCAVGLKRRLRLRDIRYQTGGGTVQQVSPDHVIWAAAPERFEAGTPAVINTLACVHALSLATQWKPCESAVSVEDLLYTDEFGGLRGEELLKALRSTLVGGTRPVPTTDGLRPFINLDNSASMPTFIPIWQTVRRVWRQPEIVHQAMITEVKTIIARFLHAPVTDYDIIFSANTTEALNLAASGIAAESSVEPVVLNTLLEHNSNELPWRYLPGLTLHRLPVNPAGFIDHAMIEDQLRAYNFTQKHGQKRITWMAVSGSSNVLGTCNDLPALARLVHQYGARLLVDGAQLVAHRPLDMLGNGIDALAFSGHKAYAPFGSGALIVRRGLLHWPIDDLNEACASGEENIVGIAALGKALILLERIGMQVVEAAEHELICRLITGLSVLPNVEIFGLRDPVDPNFIARGSTVSFSVRKIPHNLVAQELAERGGIGVRCGCFCAHLLVKELLRIHPLRAFAADLGLMLAPHYIAPLLPGLVRLSVGLENEPAEIERCLQTLQRIVNTPRPWYMRLLGSTYNGIPFLPRTATTELLQSFATTAADRVYGID
jgi:selenocysteine lyase/cysteine desulfurase